MACKILCISDSPSTLRLYQSTLELAGYFVWAAPDVKRGLKASKNKRIDCVVLDLRRDSRKATRDIKQLAVHWPRVPLLRVSLRTQTLLDFDSDGDMFITRDEAIEELPQRIEELLQRCPRRNYPVESFLCSDSLLSRAEGPHSELA